MEGRFKKYLTLGKRDRNTSRPKASAAFAVDDPDLDARPKTEGSWRLFGTTRDSPNVPRKTDENGFLASPYEAFAPGRVPIMVGTPVRGNGPVKLQTNQRLANGELIATDQDQDRILSDIRQGEYIVGKKDPPKLATVQSSPDLARRRISKDDIKRPDPALNRISPTIEEISSFRRDSKFSASTSFERGRRTRAASNVSRSGAFSPPIPRRSLSASPSRASAFGGGEEQNGAIEALWKAENTRLATVFGPGDTMGDLSGPPTAQNGLPQRAPSRGVNDEDGPAAGDALGLFPTQQSTRIGLSPSPSENASLWSTFQSPEPNTTRQDVRQMVENMRTTYLTAIEAHTSNTVKIQAPKKRRSQRSSRASNATSTTEDQSPVVDDTVVKRSSVRRSWHAGHADQSQKQEESKPQPEHVLRKQRSAQNVSTLKSSSWKSSPPPTAAPPAAKLPSVPQDVEEEEVPLEAVKTKDTGSPETSENADELPRGHTLARADSMTLGSLLKAGSPDKARSRRSLKRGSRGKEQDEVPLTANVGNAAHEPASDPRLSTDFTTTFDPSAADPVERLRPTTTSTITTLSSSASCNTIPTSAASFSSVSSSLSTPMSQPSTSPTPTIVPQTYLYNPDEAFDNSFNFDVFFHDANGSDDGVLRIIKPKRQKPTNQEDASPSSPHSPVPDLIAPRTSSRGFTS